MHQRFASRRNRFTQPNSQSLASQVSISKRAAGNDASSSKVIRGYGAVFYDAAVPGTEYWLWSDMVERVLPSAFDKVLEQDVRGLFNHDCNWVLGRSPTTMRLSIDNTGLAYEIDESPNDPMWMSVAEKINRGDVTGSSYSFIPANVLWEEAQIDGQDIWIRWIKEVEIVYDVGPVTFPAFTAATASRTVDLIEREHLIAERSMRDADDDEIAMRMRMLELDA